MRELINFFLDNPILLFFLVVTILGNLGGSAAQKARRKQQQAEKRRRIEEALNQGRSGVDPLDEPAAQTGSRRIEDAGDEVAKRIREILGRAQGAPARVEPVPPSIRPAQRTLAPPRKDHMALGFDAFGPFGEAGRSEAKRLSDAAIARGEAPAVALRPLVAPVRRVALPPGLGPRELVLAQILLGPPRAFARLEDEIVPTRP